MFKECMERWKATLGQCFERGRDVHQNAAENAIWTKPLNGSKDTVIKAVSFEQTCSGETPNFPQPVGLSLALSRSQTKGRATCYVKNCDGRGHHRKTLGL